MHLSAPRNRYMQTIASKGRMLQRGKIRFKKLYSPSQIERWFVQLPLFKCFKMMSHVVRLDYIKGRRASFPLLVLGLFLFELFLVVRCRLVFVLFSSRPQLCS